MTEKKSNTVSSKTVRTNKVSAPSLGVKLDIETLAKSYVDPNPGAVVLSAREGRTFVTYVPLVDGRTLTTEHRNALLRAGAQIDRIVKFVIVQKGKILATASYEPDQIKITYPGVKTPSTRKHAVSAKTGKLNTRTNFQLTVTEMLRDLKLVDKAEFAPRGQARKAADAQINALAQMLADAQGTTVDKVLARMKKEQERAAAKLNAKAGKASKPAAKKASAPRKPASKKVSKPAESTSAAPVAETPAVIDQPVAENVSDTAQ